MLGLPRQVASTAAGARHLVTTGHLSGLIVSAGGGEGDNAAPPDALLGASALRTLGNVLAKAAGVGLDVSWAAPSGGTGLLAGFYDFFVWSVVRM